MERFKWIEVDESNMLKELPPGYPRERAEQEVTLTRAMRDLGMEAAYPQGVVERDGTLGIMYDRVYGPDFREWMQRNPPSWSKMAALFAHEHHEVHMHLSSELPSIKSWMEGRIRTFQGLDPEMKEKVLAKLKKLPEGDNVCHWNFTPENVIFTINGPVILNWQDVSKCHYMADVARTSVLLELSIDDNLTKILHGTYVTEYIKISGRPDEELDNWKLVVVADKLCDQIETERERLLAMLSELI